jgi:hypothetical protein
MKRKIAAGLGIGAMAAVSLTGAAPAQAVTIGTIYEHVGYVGVAQQFSGPNNCTASLGNTDYNLPGLPGFNDSLSSFAGESGCRLRLFEHINYGGAQMGYFGSADSVGVFNDLASSIRFS